jgi:hypothetical protein
MRLEWHACPRPHPLFLFNQFGDLERCAFASRHVHGAPEVDQAPSILR